MFKQTMVRGLLAAALVATAVTVRADNTITLDMVPVGDAGNVADTTGYGAVAYNYQIGKYDVTAAQYTAFLNAVAATDTYGLYNANMSGPFGSCGISQDGSPGSYTYSTTKNGNFPVNYVSWGDAARFCNWLQNGQPTSGIEGVGTTETGAYMLNTATSDAALMQVLRNPGTTYFIPSQDEWYKAAYYKSGGTSAGYWSYPTKSSTSPINTLPDTGNHANFYDWARTGNGGYTDPTNYLTPVGSFVASPGPYGTYDQGGNVWQWNEANYSGSYRGMRGGSFSPVSPALISSYDGAGSPTYEENNVGFRVASVGAVPEPTSIALLLAGAVALGIWRLRRKV